MSTLLGDEARQGQQRGTDDGGSDLPSSSLPELSQDLPDDSNGAGDGGADGGGFGAGDPAFDFFRQDAIRQGYVGPRGFAEYLKQYGIMSPGKQRRIAEKEVTGLDLDRDVDGSVIQRYEVTDADLS